MFLFLPFFLGLSNPGPFVYLIQKLWATNSVEGNPNLCLDSSCESGARSGPGGGNSKKKLLVPILASVVSVGVITIVILLTTIFYIKKRPSKGKCHDKPYSMIGN